MTFWALTWVTWTSKTTVRCIYPRVISESNVITDKRKFDLMAQMGEVDTQPNVKRRKITSVDSQSALVDTTHLISSLGLDAGSRMSMTY